MFENAAIPFLGTTRRQRRLEARIEARLPALTRLACGLLKNATDAEDLVHDSCVKALTSGDDSRFDSEAKLDAWLTRILVNTFRDQYRRNQRSPLRPADYHATSDDGVHVFELIASSEQSPVDCMHNRDSSSAIRNAISALPAEVRVVSVLFLVNGLSYREIADVTDCPLGTVMSRLARGRRLLREQLADFDPRDGESATSNASGGEHP